MGVDPSHRSTDPIALGKGGSDLQHVEARTEVAEGLPGVALFAELVGIFTHDLSNPLQSLTVLLELAVDDLAPGTEEWGRLKQSLEATDRMRLLIRDFAGIARAGQGVDCGHTCGSVLEKTVNVLRRRFERLSCETVIDLAEVGQLVSPAVGFEIALIGILLGYIDGAAEKDFPSFEFRVKGAICGENATVEFSLDGKQHLREAHVPVRISTSRLEQVRAVFRDSVVELRSGETTRLDFPIGCNPAR